MLTISTCSLKVTISESHCLVALEKVVDENSEKVVYNIQTQAKTADELILWLDCDHERETNYFDVSDPL